MFESPIGGLSMVLKVVHHNFLIPFTKLSYASVTMGIHVPCGGMESRAIYVLTIDILGGSLYFSSTIL